MEAIGIATPALRPTGIEAVGEAPWGTHFCQFYATKEDLADILVPYFAAGLASDESCMWVTSPPLGTDEAWEALARAVPDLESYRRRGRIEIVPHTEWYLFGGSFDQERVLNGWVEKLACAKARGCAGLRLTGNTFWLEKAAWRSFAEYEAAVDRVLGSYDILALCTYSLERCGAAEIADVLRNHQFALLKREGAWDVIESFDRRRGQERVLRRFELLAETAGRLLVSREPQREVNALCTRVMEHLGCHVFFNFLVDEQACRLRLNACAGIPEEERRAIEWLDFGEAVCGCVAASGRRMVAERILETPDPRTDLVGGYGVRAYACHPLVGPGGLVLGTLSFGTRTRDAFSDEDLSLMKAVADQVAIAMVRLRDEQALRAKQEALREVDRRKDEFLAVLSHELRNPLAPVKSSLHVLERTERDSEQARRAEAVIRRQVDQLTHLVDDLLDVTRITRNKVALQLEDLELTELARCAAEDLGSLFERCGVALELDLPPGRVPIRADRTRVSQVIGNLLQNAAKFTPRGGHAALTVREDRREGRVVIRVTDDGAGMSSETLGRLFQPFVQAERALDGGKGGLGLGLALVKGLVELHRGEVRARSAGPGQGSELEVRLPLAAGSAEAPEPARPAPVSVPRRVLVIEDNWDAAQSLREALELGGHDVSVAYDGAEGIARARELVPDFVLCDIGLPGMDGFQVARALRSDEAMRSARLVALSGYAAPADLQRAMEAGFDLHLAKPADLRKLEELLASEG